MGKQNNFNNIVSFMNNIQKSELINRLVSFVCHDTILYLPENQTAKKYLVSANAFLGTHFQMCDTFATDDVKCQKIFEYLYGKDTVRVITEDEDIVAIGPEENKEWQYEFQKYHI